MTRNKAQSILCLQLILVSLLAACAQPPAAEPTQISDPFIIQAIPTDALGETAHAQNIILLIGDGMGEAQRRIGRWAAHGQDGSLVMDSLPYSGWSRTASADEAITDSAAGATAISTGQKTNHYWVGVDTLGNPLTTLLELAQTQGKSVGLITTVFISDATPAAFAAHVPDRFMRHEIADQMLAAEVDVLLGGGENDYLPTSAMGCYPEPGTREDNRNLIEQARANGYSYVCDLAGFRGIDPQTTSRLLGLFGDDEMLRPYAPSLLEMTQTALDILSQNSQGFFLMVEGGQIDWASHANDAENAMADVIAFDETVALALEFAASNENTLVVVAADHETGGLSLHLSPTGHPDEQGPFSMPDGTQFYVNWSTDYHTAANVPISAQGPMAESLEGTYENTHIHDVIRAAMTTEQAEPEPEEEILAWEVVFQDDFDDALQAGWAWQDEDPNLWTITGDGWLQIVGGDPSLVVQGEQANLLVRDLPDGDIALVTHLSLLPEENYQYAGLHLMDGAGNLVALTRGYCDSCTAGGGTLTLYFRQDGEWGTHITIPMEATDLFLRLAWDTGVVSGDYALSEGQWEELVSIPLANHFTQMGLGATNSSIEGVEQDLIAMFDFVEILAP